MGDLAVVRGLTYTALPQVFNRWVMPTYGSTFRWTGSRADSEDVTRRVFEDVADNVRLPELVEVVDDLVVDTALAAIARHWVDGYGIARIRPAEIRASEATPPLQLLFDDLTAEMRLVLVLRFLRRRSPATIAAQLRIGTEMAERRIIAALARVANRLGVPTASGETPQTSYVSAYIDEIVAGRRPIRFEVQSNAWPALIGAGHIHAAIAGNDLPTLGFVRSLQRRLVESSERRLVTAPRIWSA
jgi:hypothetical protein